MLRRARLTRNSSSRASDTRARGPARRGVLLLAGLLKEPPGGEGLHDARLGVEQATASW